MKPNPCCNHAHNLKRKYFQDTIARKVKRLFRAEPLPHRLVDRCKVCGCNHYLMIVPEVPVGTTGYGVGA